MILVDTNVIVALVDERDRLHRRARRDLKRLSGPFTVPSVVLSEGCFLMPDLYLRQRLFFMLERLPISAVELEPPWWTEVFQWLERYAEHEPDLCDAILAVIAARTGCSVWTYDSEFRTHWRRPDGRALSIVPSARAAR